MNICDYFLSWCLFNPDKNESTYYAYKKKYITITDRIFPSFVRAEDEKGKDMTDLAYIYAGPDFSWSHGKVTHRIMGLEKLILTTKELDILEFKNDEFIKIKNY